MCGGFNAKYDLNVDLIDSKRVSSGGGSGSFEVSGCDG